MTGCPALGTPTDILGVAVLIFLVTDPFDNIAAFLAALEGVAPGRRLRMVLRELALALGLLLLFLIPGEHTLGSPGPSREATGIAGGIILLVIVMRLTLPSSQGLLGEVPNGESLLTPLATPMVAGPSTLAVLITPRITFNGPLQELYLAMVLAWVATALILLQVAFLQRLLGPHGPIATERLAGMLLIMLSVDMLLDNLRSMLHITA